VSKRRRSHRFRISKQDFNATRIRNLILVSDNEAVTEVGDKGGGGSGEEAGEGEDAFLGDFLLNAGGGEGHDDDVAEDGKGDNGGHGASGFVGAENELEEARGDVEAGAEDFGRGNNGEEGDVYEDVDDGNGGHGADGGFGEGAIGVAHFAEDVKGLEEARVGVEGVHQASDVACNVGSRRGEGCLSIEVACVDWTVSKVGTT